jgi:hypothetical protein
MITIQSNLYLVIPIRRTIRLKTDEYNASQNGEKFISISAFNFQSKVQFLIEQQSLQIAELKRL